MRDDEARAALGQAIHCALDQKLGTGIDGAGRLVQNQHRRVLEHRTRDRQQLLLPGGDARCLGKDGVKAVRQRVDELVEAAGPADRFQLFLGDALHVVDEVFADRALEEPCVLQHHAEEPVDILAPQLARRDAVDADAAAVHLEEAHEQIDHRGLARAGRADDGNLLARLHLGREVLDDDLVRRVGVAEADMVKFDRAAHLLDLLGLAALITELFALEEVEDAVRRGGSRLHVGHALRDLRQRRGEQADIEDEGNDDAKLNRAVHRQHRADHADGDIGEVADDVHQRLHDAGEEL